MKKFLFVLLLTVLLIGCTKSQEEKITTNYEISENLVTNIEFDPSKSNLDNIGIIYKEKYFNFRDLINDEYADFYYGKVVRIENRNQFVDSIYFEIYQSNKFTSGEIRISVEKHSEILEVDKVYILHLNYSEEGDYYSLTDPMKSIFIVDGENVDYHPYFVEELKNDVNKNLYNFLNKVFK